MKDIPGFEGRYAVTEDGRVWSYPNRKVQKGTFLRLQIKPDGYVICKLYDGFKYRHKRVNRLVAETYIDNPNSLRVVNHIDFDVKNNKVENLEWCSHKHNTQHALHAGRFPVGESSYMAILNEKDVLEIRGKYQIGKFGYRKLAALYQVHPSTIVDIIKRKNWKHI